MPSPGRLRGGQGHGRALRAGRAWFETLIAFVAINETIWSQVAPTWLHVLHLQSIRYTTCYMSAPLTSINARHLTISWWRHEARALFNCRSPEWRPPSDSLSADVREGFLFCVYRNIYSTMPRGRWDLLLSSRTQNSSFCFADSNF